jgi:hypothetical protein
MVVEEIHTHVAHLNPAILKIAQMSRGIDKSSKFHTALVAEVSPASCRLHTIRNKVSHPLN